MKETVLRNLIHHWQNWTNRFFLFNSKFRLPFTLFFHFEFSLWSLSLFTSNFHKKKISFFQFQFSISPLHSALRFLKFRPLSTFTNVLKKKKKKKEERNNYQRRARRQKSRKGRREKKRRTSNERSEKKKKKEGGKDERRKRSKKGGVKERERREWMQWLTFWTRRRGSGRRWRTFLSQVRTPFFDTEGNEREKGRKAEDRDESLAAFEKDPETAINYRLISHNYRANQTPGMPRHRVSTQVREQLQREGPRTRFTRRISSLDGEGSESALLSSTSARRSSIVSFFFFFIFFFDRFLWFWFYFSTSYNVKFLKIIFVIKL